jgi:hypothetical protein
VKVTPFSSAKGIFIELTFSSGVISQYPCQAWTPISAQLFDQPDAQ